MSPHKFEVLMSDWIKDNIVYSAAFSYSYESSNNWVSMSRPPSLSRQRRFRLALSAKNKSKETRVKNVQLRVKTATSKIRFYADDACTILASPYTRAATPVYPDELGRNERTPEHYVYFRVVSEGMYFGKLFDIGIYAEIVPESRDWERPIIGKIGSY